MKYFTNYGAALTYYKTLVGCAIIALIIPGERYAVYNPFAVTINRKDVR